LGERVRDIRRLMIASLVRNKSQITRVTLLETQPRVFGVSKGDCEPCDQEKYSIVGTEFPFSRLAGEIVFVKVVERIRICSTDQ